MIREYTLKFKYLTHMKITRNVQQVDIIEIKGKYLCRSNVDENPFNYYLLPLIKLLIVIGIPARNT